MKEKKNILTNSPAEQAINSGLEIMHLKNNGESSDKMKVEEFTPFMTAPFGRSNKNFSHKSVSMH